jgi:hypothetical protein
VLSEETAEPARRRHSAYPLALYPERFYPTIDWNWQDEQVAREGAEELVVGICGVPSPSARCANRESAPRICRWIREDVDQIGIDDGVRLPPGLEFRDIERDSSLANTNGARDHESWDGLRN